MRNGRVSDLACANRPSVCVEDLDADCGVLDWTERSPRWEGDTMHCGWIEDSIWCLVRSEWQFLRRFPYALVTCIDSCSDLTTTTTARKVVQREDSCTFLGTALLVPDGKIVAIALRYALFSHFDELWLYRDLPMAGKPQGGLDSVPRGFEC